MGLYWWSAVYYGKLIDREAFQKLQTIADSTFVDKCTRKLNPTKWIFHAPGMIKKIGCIDPVLEKHELKAGAVEWGEIVNHASVWADDTDETDLKKFHVLFQEMATESEKEVQPVGFFVLQGMWSTLETETVDQISVEHNLPVVNVPSSFFSSTK